MLYIPHETSRVDLSYFDGHEIKVLLDYSQQNPFLDGIEVIVDKALTDFNPTTDHLIIAGNQVIAALCVATLMVRHGEVPTFTWDAIARTYRERLYTQPTIAKGQQ